MCSLDGRQAQASLAKAKLDQHCSLAHLLDEGSAALERDRRTRRPTPIRLRTRPTCTAACWTTSPSTARSTGSALVSSLLTTRGCARYAHADVFNPVACCPAGSTHCRCPMLRSHRRITSPSAVRPLCHACPHPHTQVDHTNVSFIHPEFSSIYPGAPPLASGKAIGGPACTSGTAAREPFGHHACSSHPLPCLAWAEAGAAQYLRPTLLLPAAPVLQAWARVLQPRSLQRSSPSMVRTASSKPTATSHVTRSTTSSSRSRECRP